MLRKIFQLFFIVSILFISTSIHGEIGNAKWVNIGPPGGSFRSFLFDPYDSQRIWVTSAIFGNIYRSDNLGSLWKKLEVFGPLRLDPFHPNTLLISNGLNLLRSTDNGDHWRVWSAGFLVTDFQFDSNKADVVYAIHFSSDDIEFSTSLDGGRNWSTKRFYIGTLLFQTAPLLIDSHNNKNMYFLASASTDDRITVFKTTDRGSTWSQMNRGLSCCSKNTQVLQMDPKNSQILFAGGPDGIFKTTNGGINWTSTHCRCGVQSITIDPQNPLRIYAVGSNYYADKEQIPSEVVSEDGGNSWQKLALPHSKVWAYREIATHPKIPEFVFASTAVGIFQSLDAGKNWQIIPQKDLFELHVSRTESDPSNPGHLYAISGAFGEPVVLETHTFGKTWKILEPLPQHRVQDILIHPADPNLIFARLDTKLAVSHDGGRSWEISKTPGIPEGILLHPKRSNVLYMWFSSRKGIARSDNYGHSWTFLPWKPADEWIQTMAIHPRTGNIIAITQFGTLVNGERDGMIWTKLSTAFSNQGIFSLQFHPRNENIVYLGTFSVTYEYTRYVLNQSRDGGRTWSIILDPVYKFALNPLIPNQIIAFSGKLIYSNNAGTTWSNLPSIGLPEPLFFIDDMTIVPWSSNPLVIAGKGIFTYQLN